MQPLTINSRVLEGPKRKNLYNPRKIGVMQPLTINNSALQGPKRTNLEKPRNLL